MTPRPIPFPPRTALAAGLCLVASLAPAQDRSRPPAVPLVTHDPYFSVWSMADRPTDAWTRHWTGKTQALCGLVRIDGKTYRALGVAPKDAPALAMDRLDVTPTRTTYRLSGGGVRVDLTFLSPLLPKDLDVLSRPATYITWKVAATDGKDHEVSLYFDATAELAVNRDDQKVEWSRPAVEGLEALRVGTVDQPVLQKKGDDLRIDWGYLYVAAPKGEGLASVAAGDRSAREGFAESGKLPAKDDDRMPRAARDDWPVLAFKFDLGRVGEAAVSRHLTIAYDDLYSIEYMGQRLRPYWRRSGMDAAAMLRAAETDYDRLTAACDRFDRELTADLERVGGAAYARVCALAYRQTLAAHKLVAGLDGKPLHFSKENFSNGCIATVDVIYPAAPFFLLLNPNLLRAQIGPVLDYSASGRWKFPFAPHDLGTYPKANGQVYGGGERTEKDQMPVEECGNMLILVAALARAEGNADFARKYWPQLEQWAKYLEAKGLDPENQLCTDDFAGHLAHNTNLSLKAIVALGGFAQLAQAAGKPDEAGRYSSLARDMARRWGPMAADGDHYRLAFDKPGTWSQKYNLVWDKLLGLGLFPPEVARTEVAYYLSHQNEFGLPLDNRSKYTKLDWIVWTATLADSRRDFEALIAPVDHFLNRTPSRVPMTDWYWTHDAKQRGFQARSVVGGVSIKMLDDPATWRKWARRPSDTAPR